MCCRRRKPVGRRNNDFSLNWAKFARKGRGHVSTPCKKGWGEVRADWKREKSQTLPDRERMKKPTTVCHHAAVLPGEMIHCVDSQSLRGVAPTDAQIQSRRRAAAESDKCAFQSPSFVKVETNGIQR